MSEILPISSTTAVAKQEILIEPAGRLVPLNLHELWQFRDLVFFLLWRDVKGRYRQMALGPLWMIINPLLNMVLFTVVFSMIASMPSDGIPYPLFNYSALLPWGFFSGVVFAAANSLLGYKDLISKVYFPRLVIPLVSVLSGLIDLAISMVILFGMMIFYGYMPTWNLLWLPVYLVLAALAGLSVGIWFAPWIVHYRDINMVLGYVVRVWMYATPVVYASSLVDEKVPEPFRTLYYYNPATQIVEGARWSLLGVGHGPSWILLPMSAVLFVVLVMGCYYYRRTERSIVDIA